MRLGEGARLHTGDRDVRTLDALAAAFASAGRFAEAIDTLERAIALVAPGAAGSADTLRLLRARLSVYGRGEPFRDVSRADAR